MYWLPKLHKRPYKARFIANSSSCTNTELLKSLTSCLTAVTSRVIRNYETMYERSKKNLSWSIKNSGKVLSKLKSIGFTLYLSSPRFCFFIVILLDLSVDREDSLTS